MTEKTKILVIGGTGHWGKSVVEASVRAGHPTFALVRESTYADPIKAKLIETFSTLGVTLLLGDLFNHKSLVKAIKQVDVVISTVGHAQLADQANIVAAIKEAGNIKRFFPSEFGNDVDHTRGIEPMESIYKAKWNIRRDVEAEGIPYTYASICCSAEWFLPSLLQHGATTPPRDQVIIPGDGNVKAVFNKEDDVCTYILRAVDDPRTLNKILYVRPESNTCTFNELVSMWEKKIGKILKRSYVSEEQILKNIQESPYPENGRWALKHSVFVKGDYTYFDIEPSFGVEASELYPDVKYTTVDEYLDQFI